MRLRTRTGQSTRRWIDRKALPAASGNQPQRDCAHGRSLLSGSLTGPAQGYDHLDFGRFTQAWFQLAVSSLAHRAPQLFAPSCGGVKLKSARAAGPMDGRDLS